MIDKLKGLNGDAFEKQYRSDQISGHKDTVDLYKRYAKGGDNADLKSWASKSPFEKSVQWTILRKRRLPSAMWIMASETSMRSS